MLTDLAFNLVKEGSEVSIICSSQSYDKSNSTYKKYEEINSVKVYRVKTTDFGRNWLPGRVIDYMSYFLGMVWLLFNTAQKGDIVVAKTDPPLTSALTYPIAKLKKAEHVNWVQDLFPEVAESLGIKLFPHFIARLLRRLRNWSFANSRVNVVIGERMKQRLLDQNIPTNSIVVIPNWANNDEIKPIEKQNNPLKVTWNLSDKFVVLYSGNMGRVHEFGTIIRAAETLKNRPEFVFLFIGGGPQKEYLQQEVKSKNLTNVILKPYQDYGQLSQSLSIGDVHLVSLRSAIEGYCVPSKYYGILAVGRPVIFIGDPSGEIGNIINNDESGMVIPEGNSDLLTDSIYSLAQDTLMLEKMAANASRSVNEKYNSGVSMKKWKDTLDSISV